MRSAASSSSAVECFQLHTGVEDLVCEGRHLVEPPDQKGRKSGERDDVADPELAQRHEQRADQQHHHHRNGRGEPVQCAGERPPVEHRVLRGEQRPDMAAQSLGFMTDAIVALQHRDVSDRIRHMREDVVVVALDRLLALFGLAHDQPADHHIGRAEHHQHQRHPDVERQGRRNQQHQRNGGREMLAHEFEPEREQRFDGPEQRVQRVRGSVLMVPRQRHGDDALEGRAQRARPPRMGDTVGAARHQDERHDVERAQSGPERQRRHDLAFLGDGVDDPAEQHRFGDRHHGEHDIGEADGGDPGPVGSKIPKCPPVNLEQ